MGCSLLSSQTLKSLTVRSRQPAPEPAPNAPRKLVGKWRCRPFRSTESSVEIACPASYVAEIVFPKCASRNFDCAVFRRHQLSIRISYHEPDQIAARLDVKTRLQSDPRSQLVQGFVFPPHRDVFLRSLKKDPVLIEERRNYGQFIGVSTIYFPIVNALHIHMSEDRELGLGIAGLKKLGMKFHRQIVHFFLGEDGVLDLQLGFFRGVRGMFWSIVSAAGLKHQPRWTFQRDFQFVIAAIEL